MPRIRITGELPQAKYGQVTGDPDDEWIRKILDYESKSGSSTGGGLSNFGYNDWKKFGHKTPPATMEQAVQYFKEDFLPKVANYPAGVKERLADYMYNTGRSPKDLLLRAADRITLDDLNSSKTWDTLYDSNKGDIEKLFQDPKFLEKLDNAKIEVYKTTPDKQNNLHYTLENPNPAFEKSWKNRVDLWKPQPTTSQTPSAQPSVQTSAGTATKPAATPAVTPTTVSTTPATKINTPIWQIPTFPTPPAPVTSGPVVPPEKTKTPYTPPTDPVATIEGPVLKDFSQPAGAVDLWAPTSPGITGETPKMPVNPNAPKQYPIDYDELNKGSIRTKLKEDDIVDPRDFLRKQRRQRNWDKVEDTLEDVGYGVTHPGEMIGKGATWLDDKITQGAKWLNENKKFQKYAGKADKVVQGAAAISPIVDYITDLKKQKRWDKWFTEGSLSDNLYAARPASMTGNRGDWDINTGIFRPNEIGFKSKGQYTNQFNYAAPGTGVAAYGGSINNNPMEKVRIRITGGNEKMATGGQPMTYSGQLGYGINLGQKRIYTDMPPDKSETVNNTLQAIPREQANIEAERGETVFGDLDGDGALEHMLIGGKKHTQGGTPLNVPEGSFIFSDTKDLIIKDRKILDKFNMPANKKGYTPAEIAKKYEMNKYKAVMEDENADPIKKSTAQIMIKTFQKKLAELALIQEQMKGFPQGIPEIAKKFNPKLQTKEDQEKQPGVSDNLQFGQPQGPEEEQAEGPEGQNPQEEQMEPQMEYGGMIPKYLLAGEVDNDLQYNTNNALVNLGLVGAGPGDPNAVEQTLTPTQRAALNDPEFAKFQALMKKYDTGKYKSKNAVYVNALSPTEAAEFARLATKFGFSRGAEGAVGSGDSPTWNAPGYRIIQGATPGFSMTDAKGKKFGFFGGFTPDLYEKRVVEDVYGKEASDKMTDVERRRAFFKEIGIDDSKFNDAQLSKPKTLYQNKDFFKNTFYPAFTKTFAKEGFRPEMQDDMLIGAEHYDSYKNKPKPTDETIIGYKCTGRDPKTGKANVISSSYMNTAARDADGAATTEAEAYKQCPEEPIKPGTPKDPCPPGYYRDVNGKCVKTPFDFMTPDKVNMFAAALGAPKKYLPWGQKLPFEPGDVVFKDWRAKAAERQSLINKMADQLNTYSPGTSTASNLSFLVGQQAEGLIKDIDEVDAYNVQTANAFADRERQRKDQNNLYNLAKTEDLYKGNVIANQQYDNAKRQYFNNMAKTYGQAWKNRMQLGLLNSVNPMFNIDPWQGQSYFKGGYGANEIGNSMFGTATASSGTTYRDKMADYLKRGYTLADARKYAAEDDRKGSTASATNPKQAALLQARALMSGYGGLGSNFNADEETAS